MILPQLVLLPVLLLFLPPLQLLPLLPLQHPLLFFTIATIAIPVLLPRLVLQDKPAPHLHPATAPVLQKSINAKTKAAAQHHLPAPQLALL